MANNTIAAISTPLGSGGIGIVRISGKDAFSVADSVFSSVSGKKIADQKGYSALFGSIVDENEYIDRAVAIIYHSPKSYTGEDTVELSVHGGNFIVKKVLRAVLSHGAVLAEAGEFTKRAFLNGKIDLTEAESVMGLIGATNEAQLKMNNEAHLGRIRRETDEIESKLLGLAAAISVYCDYPDEELPETDPKRIKETLFDVIDSLEKLISNYDRGRIIGEGIETAIIGKPNVGKSTVMNLLAGKQRSIVTDIAGTTRDVIEDTVTLADITLRLSDTAGIHSTENDIEAMGVELAKEKCKNAELVFAVFDSSEEFDQDDRKLLELLNGKKAIIILNKSDKPAKLDTSVFKNIPTVIMSAKDGIGLEKLEEILKEVTEVSHLDPNTAVLVSERQRSCANDALSHAKAAYNAYNDGLELDAVGVIIDDAVSALLSLTGKRVTNEVADEVFRRFCVGK